MAELSNLDNEPKRAKRDSFKVAKERAILVEVSLHSERRSMLEEPLGELTRLTEAAGGQVVGTALQKRSSIDAGMYVGSGKAAELGRLAAARDADVIIFDNDLSPGQIRNLEKVADCKVLDRSELILDIFASRARTAEAKLQVELAQLEYTYPRLTRMWSHLSRLHGGMGTRGPGETQLESDRRLVRRRIVDLKRRLHEIENRRERLVRGRWNEFGVSLVGYTNAGKSSILNALTNDDAYVADQLFATLDTRTRSWMLPFNLRVLLSDTVGFVRDLPHHLVASFRATLEEARTADLLLHVIDASALDFESQVEAVNKVLAEIGCVDKPVLLVFNKCDLLRTEDEINVLEFRYPNSVVVSAATGAGLEKLAGKVLALLAGEVRELTIRGPSTEGAWQAALAKHAGEFERDFSDSETLIRTRLPQHLVDYLLQEYPALQVATSRGELLAAPVRVAVDKPFET